MNNQEMPSSMTIGTRRRVVAATAIFVGFGVMIGIVAFALILSRQHSIQLDMNTSNTSTDICINGLAYEFKKSDSNPNLGGGVEILELVKEPKGQVRYGPDGREYPRMNGPKACIKHKQG
jgi:hypothetical protein